MCLLIPTPEPAPSQPKTTHKGGLEFHLVTSRQFRIQPETEAWIAQHYPDIFTKLHFGNHYALGDGA